MCRPQAKQRRKRAKRQSERGVKVRHWPSIRASEASGRGARRRKRAECPSKRGMRRDLADRRSEEEESRASEWARSEARHRGKALGGGRELSIRGSEVWGETLRRGTWRRKRAKCPREQGVRRDVAMRHSEEESRASARVRREVRRWGRGVQRARGEGLRFWEGKAKWELPPNCIVKFGKMEVDVMATVD